MLQANTPHKRACLILERTGSSSSRSRSSSSRRVNEVKTSDNPRNALTHLDADRPIAARPTVNMPGVKPPEFLRDVAAPLPARRRRSSSPATARSKAPVEGDEDRRVRLPDEADRRRRDPRRRREGRRASSRCCFENQRSSSSSTFASAWRTCRHDYKMLKIFDLVGAVGRQSDDGADERGERHGQVAARPRRSTTARRARQAVHRGQLRRAAETLLESSCSAT
jgi:hypothetical protein